MQTLPTLSGQGLFPDSTKHKVARSTLDASPAAGLYPGLNILVPIYTGSLWVSNSLSNTL